VSKSVGVGMTDRAVFGFDGDAAQNKRHVFFQTMNVSSETDSVHIEKV
jgi:hypothetical protein